MATMNDEQENGTPELTNLMDVVAAETGSETEVETETEVVVEIMEAVEIIETVEIVETAEAVVVVETTIIEEVVVIEETAVIEPVTETVEEAVPETAVEEKPAKQQKQQRKQRPKRRSSVTSRDVKRWFSSCGRCGFFLAAYELLETEVDLETAVSHTKGEWITLDWNYEIRNLVNKSYGYHVDTGYLDTGCPECRRRFIIDSDGDERSFRIALNPAIKR